MGLEVDDGEPARGRGLVDGRGVEVGGLLGHGERPPQRLGRAHPSDPQPGRGDLGERREGEHEVLRAGQRGERGHRLAARSAAHRTGRPRAAKAPRARRPPRAPPARERERPAGRVLEGRDGVEQPRAVARGERRDGVRVEAVVVARDRHHLRAGELEGLQRGEIRRLLDEHRVARLEQHGRDQRQRLLGAARDQQLLGRRSAGRASVSRAATRGAQRRVALRRRVLQRAPGGRGRRARRRTPSRNPGASNSSGAGRPPANEMTPGCSVSARMSRTGEERTPRRRAARRRSGGSVRRDMRAPGWEGR